VFYVLQRVEKPSLAIFVGKAAAQPVNFLKSHLIASSPHTNFFSVGNLGVLVVPTFLGFPAAGNAEVQKKQIERNAISRDFMTVISSNTAQKHVSDGHEAVSYERIENIWYKLTTQVVS
jgi:hypothetical protein